LRALVPTNLTDEQTVAWYNKNEVTMNKIKAELKIQASTAAVAKLVEVSIFVFY
jgi:hypothetical protein